MKKMFLGLLLAMSVMMQAGESDDPVLMTIGGQDISVSEFEYMYNKNNTGDMLEKKSIDEYLDLYVRFKLKVIDAENAGMDTAPAFLNEFRSYRSQLTRPYLIDKKLEDSLYRVAYEHLKEDVEVAHILFAFPRKCTPADTLMVYNRAMEAYKRLQNENFEVVAMEMSDDNSVKDNKGYLGFLTGLSVVWPMEKAMYETPIGRVSKPIRTNYGYHIIRVLSRRPAVGEVRASHILISCTDKMSEKEQTAAYDKIKELKKRIDAGEDFATLAEEYSEDKGSAKRGGDLSWFGIGRMVLPFETATFELSKGEVSEPVKTNFGWHLIKVTDKRGIEPFEEKKADIQKFMQYDERSSAPQKAFVEKLKREYDVKMSAEGLNLAKSVIEPNMDNDSIMLTAIKGKDSVELAKINGEVLPVTEFVEYYALRGNHRNVDKVAEEWLDREILKYEDGLLEYKYPEFGHLMSEYHDGLLLFDINNKNVWEKASKDTAGLEAFFNAHKKEYTWKDKRFKGFLIRCVNDSVADVVKGLYNSVSTDSLVNKVRLTMNSDSVTQVLIERGLWKKGDNAAVDKYAFKDKKAEFTMMEKFPVVFTLGKMLKKYPESYLDVRGAVTSDYQNYLEEEWVKELESKYQVVLNRDVYETVKLKYEGGK